MNSNVWFINQKKLAPFKGARPGIVLSILDFLSIHGFKEVIVCFGVF